MKSNYLSIFLFACLCMLNVQAQPADAPKRKSGLWEIKMSHEGKPGMQIKQCIDEKTDNMMQSMGKEVAQQCSKQEFKKVSGGYDIESVCKLGSSTATTKGTVRGNMESGYAMDLQISHNPPTYGMSEAKMRIENKFLGACPSGWTAGDMEMPGGMRINANQLGGMRKP
ncbi:MAG: hypothetical protein RLZZ502_1293 [Pseudomonadota bacterium]|jgi:hypothetical protein